MLQTAQYFKTSNDKVAVGKNIVPLKSEHDYPFAYSLKIGTMVLLYEKSPNEIWDASLMDNNKRLYKVVGLSAMRMKGRNVDYATIKLKHHEEARLSTELKAKMVHLSKEKNCALQ